MPWWATWGWQRVREELWARAFIVVSRKEHMSQTGSRLTGVSNFNRLWGIESSLVVWYLTLGWLG